MSATPKSKTPPASHRAGRRHVRPADALLAHGTLDDRDRPAAPVVVVEAGVVPGHPADEPRDGVVRLQQRVEHALRGVVADAVLPQRRARREVRRQVAQLVDVQGSVVRHAASLRAPVSMRAALTVASRSVEGGGSA